MSSYSSLIYLKLEVIFSSLFLPRMGHSVVTIIRIILGKIILSNTAPGYHMYPSCSNIKTPSGKYW